MLDCSFSKSIWLQVANQPLIRSVPFEYSNQDKLKKFWRGCAFFFNYWFPCILKIVNVVPATFYRKRFVAVRGLNNASKRDLGLL